MIKLKADSRSKRWSVAKTFGQATVFPDSFKVKDSQPDFIQRLGDVECTAITCADIGSDKDGFQYDHEDLFKRIPSDQSGAIPQDALNETVKGGLLPVGQTRRITTFSSYYEAHSGAYDAFDNVRSALITVNYPVAVYTRWYAEWINKDVLPVGQNPVSGHMYTVEGWEQINGEPMLIVEAWLGYKLHMSRQTFNKAISVWGCGTAVLSTLQQDISRRKTIIEKLIDLYKNLYLLITQSSMDSDYVQPAIVNQLSTEAPAIVNKTPVSVDIAPTDTNKLDKFCQAISEFEGGPNDLNHKNNNPGNLRSIKGPFLRFKTWDEGMNALKDYVTRAATGKHNAYKPSYTIYQFFATYAPAGDNNSPKGYAEWVCKKVGIEPTMRISDLVKS